MRILSFRTNHGPNVFHTSPTIIMSLDLENLTEKASSDLPGFIPRLLETFPGLVEHTCSLGSAGGFVLRLNKGTYMAHVVEHVAIELSALCGIGVHYGKSRYAGHPGFYEIVTTFKNEDGMKECLKQAVAAVEVIVQEKTPEVDLKKIRKLIEETSLGTSGRILVEAALRKNIPCRRLLNENSLLQLGYGINTRHVQSAVTTYTGLIATDLAQDKDVTKRLLRENFFPVPNGKVVDSEEGLAEAAAALSPPFVIKPLDGNHGRGVLLNLTVPDELIAAYRSAKKISEKVIIEEMCNGKDYRVLAVNGKIVAVAQRLPPSVSGDGKKNLVELIDEVNSDPRRETGHSGLLTKIEVDETVQRTLFKAGITDLNYIPESNELVVLRENANLSSGGTAIDVTGELHPQIKLLCERAARVMGLDICGIDLIHADISKPPDNLTRIIEVNAGPGLRMHAPSANGNSRDIGGIILDMLYPDGASTVPIVAVTGTNGKTTVVRMLHKIFSDQIADGVGLTTTDGIWIGDDKVFEGDTTGPQSSRLVLSDPKVKMAVLEVARGGLLRGGLSYDWADVGVITNIQRDHFGQDGIEDLEDLVWIKSLVGERVKKNGTLVLNADDGHVLAMRGRPKIIAQELKFFLFSKNERNRHLKKHLAAGGDGCWYKNGWIWIHFRGKVEKLKVSDIPMTANGAAEFQILNLMAGTAAALALGASRNQIVKSLQEFRSINENVGRFNIFRIGGSYLILDYGHNCDAFLAIGRMLDQFDGYKKTVAVGMPGDRRDDLIEDATDILIKHFDNFLIKEDCDLRGRAIGEVPRMLHRNLLRNNPLAQVKIVLNEADALREALHGLEEPEIVVFFYEKYIDLLPVLAEFSATPVDAIPKLEDEELWPRSIADEYQENRV